MELSFNKSCRIFGYVSSDHIWQVWIYVTHWYWPSQWLKKTRGKINWRCKKLENVRHLNIASWMDVLFGLSTWDSWYYHCFRLCRWHSWVITEYEGRLYMYMISRWDAQNELDNSKGCNTAYTLQESFGSRTDFLQGYFGKELIIRQVVLEWKGNFRIIISDKIKVGNWVSD